MLLIPSDQFTQLPLFVRRQLPDRPRSLSDKFSAAVANVHRVLASGHLLLISWSAGKDSSAVATIAITAALKLRSEGATVPPIYVLFADTGVENPEYHAYAMSEISKIERFAEKSGLEIHTRISRPALNDSWPVRVISGRAWPVFPGNRRDCTYDLKIIPMRRLKKWIVQEAGKSWKETVNLVGTRFSESAVRRNNMKSRKERDDIPWRKEEGELMLSPIANWTTEDVWELLKRVSRGEIRSYSDFQGTKNLYAAASDPSEPMSSRFGCVTCTAGRDHSLEAMLASNPEKYGYLKPFNDLHRFILATRFDFSRRNWIGRTIDEDGYIKISPDAYSPGMMEELLRYVMTIDVREAETASRLNIEPRFQLIGPRELIAIDAVWGLQGFHRPFHALQIYDDIYNRGLRYPIPDIRPFPRRPIPARRFYHVGSEWSDASEYRGYLGLRHPVLEMTAELSGCGIDFKKLKNGAYVVDFGVHSSSFDVDEEGAYLILDLELDDCLKTHANEGAGSLAAYYYYLSMGVVSLPVGKEWKIDEILRRTAFRIEKGLVGPDYEMDEICPQGELFEEYAA